MSLKELEDKVDKTNIRCSAAFSKSGRYVNTYNTLQSNTHFFVSRASSRNSKSCFVLGHCPVVSLSARELVNAG